MDSQHGEVASLTAELTTIQAQLTAVLAEKTALEEEDRALKQAHKLALVELATAQEATRQLEEEIEVTHPVDIPCQHTLSIHPVNANYQYILLSIYILSTYPVNISCHHKLQYQYSLSLHTLSTFPLTLTLTLTLPPSPPYANNPSPNNNR